MSDRLLTAAWRFGLLGPVVVAFLFGSTAAHAETPRTPRSEQGARWWGPLRLSTPPVAAKASAPQQKARRPARAVGAGAHLGQACQSDNQCVDPGTICEKRRCVKVRRTINVLWLFYRSADRRYTSALGLYHHKKGTPGMRILAPLYFHVWSEKRDTRVVLPPFFAQHRNHPRKSVDTVVLNVHHHRSPEAVSVNVWPLLFAKRYRKGQGLSFTLAPLFHYGRRGKAWSAYSLLPLPFYVWRRPGRTSWGALPFAAGFSSRRRSLTWVFPLNFHWRRGKRRYTVLFPLYFGAKTRHRSLSVLLPLYWYERRGAHRRQFVSPLVVYGHDRLARRWHFWWTAPPILFARRPGERLDMVLPLFLHRRRARKDRLWVFPALLSYAYRRGQYREGLVGPLHYQRGGRRSHTVLFPLFWQFKNHRTQWSWTVAGNVFVRQDPTSYNAGVLPLVYFGRSAQHHYQIFLPLFWNRREPRFGHVTTQVLNGYYWRRRASFGHGLLPLYFFERRYDRQGYVSSKLGILPFVYHQNSRRSRLVLTPLGGYYHDRDAGRRTLLAGNFLWHRTPQRTLWSVLPLLWHHRGPSSKDTVLFPLYWRFHAKGDWRVDLLLPVFAHLRKRNRRLLIVGPYFYRRRGKVRYGGLLPLLVWHRNRIEKQVTVWSGPFLYRQRGHRRFGMLAPLLFVSRQGPAQWSVTAPPLLHYRRDRYRQRLWTPLFGFGVDRQRHRRYGYVGPVGWSATEHRSAQVVFPLFWRFANRRARTATVVVPPVYFGMRHRRGRTDVLPPLFVHRRVGSRRTVVLFPLLWAFTHRRRHDVTVLPFVHVRTRPGRLSVITPLFGFGVDRGRDRRFGYVGPVGWSSSPTRSAQVVFPLFWRVADRRAQTTTVAVPPLYFGYRHRRGRTDVLPPLFVHRRVGSRRTVVLFPLLWSFTDRGRRDVTVLPFVHVHQRPGRLSVATPLFGFGVDRRRGRRFGYVGPVGWSSSPTRSTQVVFPLIWHHRSPRGRTVVVAPLFAGRFRRDGSSWSAIFPLWYHSHGRDRRTTVVFPLVWHRRRAGRSTTVVFPLGWDFVRGQRRRTVVFPLVWRFANKRKVHTVVLNTYYGRSREDSTYRLLVLPLLEVARKRPGDFKIGFLGGLVGYERIGRNRYLKLFFARIRLKPLPRAPVKSSRRLRRQPLRPFFPI